VHNVAGPHRLPVWAPLAVLVAGVAATLLFWQAVVADRRSFVDRATAHEAELLAARMSAEARAQAQGLYRMAQRWEARKSMPEEEWESDTRLYVAHNSGYQAIVWVDPSSVARWIVPLPGNEGLLGVNLADEPLYRETLETARQNGDKTLSRPVRIAKGSAGFLACSPIYLPGAFGGWIVGIIRFDPLLNQIWYDELAQGYTVSLVYAGHELYRRGTRALSPDAVARDADVELSGENLVGVSLRLRVWPSQALLAARSSLPRWTLIAGLLVSCLLSLSVGLAQTARRRAGEAEVARRALEAEVLERKRAEQELRQSQKMEAVGRLAGGVAHDFNNLLTAILGYGDLLYDALDENPTLQGEADEIRKAANRAASLTRQLLAFSRRQLMVSEVVHLNELVSGMEKMLRRLIGEDVEVATALDPALGAVKADPGQLEQVLLNLALNARDAMPQGGRLTIETANVHVDESYSVTHSALVRPGAYVLLSVSDTGVGMDEATRLRVFEPFFTTKEPGKGTGLGLAMVYGIVKQTGGFIWVYSEPDRGTTFKVYLPITEETKGSARVSAPPETAVRGEETILLVEDEDPVRALARRMLEAAGYRVLEARQGAEALEIAENFTDPIHLVLTDTVMPGMGGPELAGLLAESHPETRALFMSGYADDAVLRHGILEGDAPFLQKPFTAGMLTRRVREVLDQRRA
jgi:signal transduction histidine kinase/ActR/RegA family two-component response regulator